MFIRREPVDGPSLAGNFAVCARPPHLIADGGGLLLGEAHPLEEVGYAFFAAAGADDPAFSGAEPGELDEITPESISSPPMPGPS
jgi:hypothetical protein